MTTAPSNSRRRIAPLPPQVANQIAAGEVVERPASVVKELVENAIDAGAGRVEVHLEEGGRKLIRVVDDGHGIAADQALLAFERHATSKIRDARELARVASYGFRGEALASIASIAPVEMRTRPADAELGTLVAGSGDGELSAKPVSCAPGTDLRVRELFASVPARREFLRTPATELGHVIRLLDAVALARPHLHLLLNHNGRKVSDYPPAQDLTARAAVVLGADVARHLQPVHGDGPYQVDGVLSSPALTRGTSAGLVLLVDGRPVSDATLVHAIRAAYGSRLPDRRYPVGALRVQCPSATVDVNVHPSKTEVRFLSKQAVHAAVVAAVSDMVDQEAWLEAEDLAAPVTRKGARPARPTAASTRRRSYLSDLFNPPDVVPQGAGRPRPPAPSSFRRGSPGHTPGGDAPEAMTLRPSLNRPAAPVLSGVAPERSGAVLQTDWRAPTVTRDVQVTLVLRSGGAVAKPTSARYVGQLWRSWLLFETDSAALLVRRRFAASTVFMARGGTGHKRLMIPARVALGEPLVAALRPAFKRLARHGLELAVGPTSGVLARTAPNGMSPTEIDEVVRRIAGRLVASGNITSAQMHALIDEELAAACAPADGAEMSESEAGDLALGLDGLALSDTAEANVRVVQATDWLGTT